MTDCFVCVVPSPPWNVTARQLNAQQVLVSWQAPRSPNGTIVSYMVYQTPPIPPICNNLHTSSKTSFIVNGDYSANANYSFWVSDFLVNMCVHVVPHLTLIIVMCS
jgi:Fibronectin type III domain.